MISKETYLTAVSVSEGLTDQNIALKAAPSSVLGELVDLSVSVNTVDTTMPA